MCNVQGSLITVENIFKKIPVRYNHFQSPANFNASVKQRMVVFEAYAIAFDIRLKLVISGIVRFNTSGKNSALERYQSVFNNVLR